VRTNVRSRHSNGVYLLFPRSQFFFNIRTQKTLKYRLRTKFELQGKRQLQASKTFYLNKGYIKNLKLRDMFLMNIFTVVVVAQGFVKFFLTVRHCASSTPALSSLVGSSSVGNLAAVAHQTLHGNYECRSESASRTLIATNAITTKAI